MQAVGATPYIPFRANSVARNRKQKHDPLWERMYHYYNLNRAEFLAHYHKRSNVETVFAMIKAKFGADVRSKTPAAQVNEVLVKIDSLVKVCVGRIRTNVPTPGYNIQSLFRILPQHTVALRCAKSLELPQNGLLRGNQRFCAIISAS